MRQCGPFGLVEPPVLAIIVMQAPELQLRFFNSPHKPDHFVGLALFDSCSIHAWIYVDKHVDGAASPLPHLFFVLDQDRDPDVREMIRYFEHAACICAHHWVGKKDVGCSAVASYQQFERGCALETPDTPLDKHAKRVGQLCGLDVRTPAIRIVPEQMQSPRN